MVFLVFRKQVRELDARARRTHHRSNGVSPFSIVRGFFVCFRCRFISVDLHQNEPGRIRCFLHHIEPGNSRFLDAVPRILECSFDKGADGFGVHLDVDMNNEHTGIFDSDLSSCKDEARTLLE